MNYIVKLMSYAMCWVDPKFPYNHSDVLSNEGSLVPLSTADNAYMFDISYKWHIVYVDTFFFSSQNFFFFLTFFDLFTVFRKSVLLSKLFPSTTLRQGNIAIASLNIRY